MKSGAAISILAAASTVSAIHIPVSRVKPRIPLSPELTRRGFNVLAAGGGVALTNSQNNIYTSTVQIKGQGKFFLSFSLFMSP